MHTTISYTQDNRDRVERELKRLDYKFYVEDILIVIPEKIYKAANPHAIAKLVAFGAFKAVGLMGRHSEGRLKTFNGVLIKSTSDRKLFAEYITVSDDNVDAEREEQHKIEYLQKEKVLLQQIKHYKEALDKSDRDLVVARKGRKLAVENKQVLQGKFEASEKAYTDLRAENARLVARIAELEAGGQIVQAEPVAVDAVDVTTVSRAVRAEEQIDILFRALDKLTK